MGRKTSHLTATPAIAMSTLSEPVDAQRGPLHRLDARWLHRHCVFDSDDVDHARAFVSSTLNDHRLRPGRGRFDMRMHRIEMPTMTACLLHYGSEVEILTESLERFVLVQIPMSGAINIRYGNVELTATPETAQVLPSRTPLRLSWTEGCTQMLLKIPTHRVSAMCGQLLGHPAPEPVEFRSDLYLQAPAGQDWTQLLNLLFSQHGEARDRPAHAHIVRQLEDTLISHLLCHQPNNYTARLSEQFAPLAPRHVRAAEAYMLAKMQDPLTLEDIAASACVSVRTLCRAFKDARGTTPMAMLRTLRLARAHEELAGCEGKGSVTEIAMKWGFTHLSRFAASYRERYGESPFETLKK